LKLFNRCTTPIYWADWGWANPNTRKKYLECAQWASDNHLRTRGHCIIYPGWSFLPAAVRPLEKDPVALRKRLLEHVADVTEATRRFNFSEYDVCNELRDLQEIHGLLGRDAVAEWFKVAREHAPNSRMAINENTILTRGGFTQTEQDNYAGWIQYLIDQGQGPDVIGMQSHFGEAVTGPETVLRILDRFAKFGKPIQITEFDLVTRDEQGQARYTRDFLTAVFSHPATDAFTMWGFWEGRMWQPPGAMIRKDWTLKPNGQAWMDLTLKEWWTDVTMTTGADGSCTTRGFLGDYRVTVTAVGKEKSVLLSLAKPANTTVVAVD
jgi:endo-1,4-beta-xylanase